MPRVDFYRILGVSREASEDVIKKAYRKLVFEHHPDRNPNSKQAEDKIREINAAYEVIGDGRKARVIDTNGTAKNPVGIYGVKLVQP